VAPSSSFDPIGCWHSGYSGAHKHWLPGEGWARRLVKDQRGVSRDELLLKISPRWNLYYIWFMADSWGHCAFDFRNPFAFLTIAYLVLAHSD
jgi:hypothetical protein